jgi:hypothetical protein
MAQDGNPIGGEPGQGMGGRSERSGGSGAAPHEGGELGGSAQGANPGDLGGFGGGAGGGDRAASEVDDGRDVPSDREMSGEDGESGVGTGGGG